LGRGERPGKSAKLRPKSGMGERGSSLVMQSIWKVRPCDLSEVNRLLQGGLSPITAQVLVARGIGNLEAARRFLEGKLTDLHDPSYLPGCDRAVELLWETICRGDGIAIYGDYDVDGITGTAILCGCIRLLGGRVISYIPSRLDEGYGLNRSAIEYLADSGTRVLVTVDCGVASPEEVAAARALGMEVLITDHHTPGPVLPPASAIVHPRLPVGSNPFPFLSGAAVAFKLAWALCRRASGGSRVGEAMRSFLLQATGLAALGTIADVVPLLDENRILVRQGLAALIHTMPLGLRKLAQVARLKTEDLLDAEKIAYQIAPRLNAAGRLSRADLAVELLLTDQEDLAERLASELNQLNEERRSLESGILEAAMERWMLVHSEADPAALVLDDARWHPGVIGIVAGKLAERLARPVVLISSGENNGRRGVGSARGVPGFNLFEALQACAHLLTSFGGHAGAAGLTLPVEQIPEFRRQFVEVAENMYPRTAEPNVLWIDAEVPFGLLTEQVVEQLERLGPFGHGNPRPVLCAQGVRLAYPPQSCGAQGQHLVLRVVQGDIGLRAVAFQRGHWAASLAPEMLLDMAFQPVLNRFGGTGRVELHLIDWRLHAADSGGAGSLPGGVQ